MKMENVLAIDPSLKWMHCVLSWQADPESLVCMIAASVPRQSIGSFLLAHSRFDIKRVVYEDPYLGKNVKQFAQAYHVRESLNEYVQKIGAVFVPITALQWQSMLFLSGESSKSVGRMEIKKRSKKFAQTVVLGFDPGSQDLCDAACMWYAAANGMILTDEDFADL